MSSDSKGTAPERGGAGSLTGRSGPRRVVVTGASGFLGRAVVARLIEAGWSVDATGSSAQAPDHMAAGVRWHSVDLLERDAARKLFSRVEASHLMHLAWAPNRGVYASPENFRWVRASARLFESFFENGGRRAVGAGSSAEYDWSCGVCRERSTPLAGGGAYGTAKRALAELFQGHCERFGASGAWARIFFLFGPHEGKERLVAAVARALIQGAPVRCSAGTQVRDYLYVEDAADALVELLESEVSGPVNIASGAGIRVRDLVLELAARSGTREDGQIIWGAAGHGGAEAALVVADVGRLTDEVGWQPPIGVSAGIDRTLSWWRERLAAEVAAAS